MTGAPEPDEKPPSRLDVALRPRWLWITFAVVSLAVPAVGLWLERAP